MIRQFACAVDALLKAHADLSALDAGGITAVHLAVIRIQHRVANVSPYGSFVEGLLHFGADVNIPNNWGLTAFHLAMIFFCQKEAMFRLEWIDLFLRHGADVTLPMNSFGDLPFEWFLARDHSRSANIADISSVTKLSSVKVLTLTPGCMGSLCCTKVWTTPYSVIIFR